MKVLDGTNGKEPCAQRANVEIFTFARAIVTPTKEDFKNAYDVKWWRFDKNYLKYYQSTVLNTSKPTRSSKRWSIITTFLIFMAMIAYFIYPAIGLTQKMKDTAQQPQQPTQPPQTQQNPYITPITQPNSQIMQPPQTQPTQPQELITDFIRFGNKCTAYLQNGQQAPIGNDECLQYATGKKFVELKPKPQPYNYDQQDYAQQAEQLATPPTH
ncbi:hypothetical protein MOMA_07041 [Moraxella macacae 0408225]|uniref:Uncharacterized protein n=1 Tax=Moraxella macacae 0408225 TaxID=1230338 RepID=L2F761_9GAMM|nr:hypothetical protein [Moraxella macacae]ELA08298.1 hypothetical protein MOMA_07041 [Moraxella macacae 0408225]